MLASIIWSPYAENQDGTSYLYMLVQMMGHAELDNFLLVWTYSSLIVPLQMFDLVCCLENWKIEFVISYVGPNLIQKFLVNFNTISMNTFRLSVVSLEQTKQVRKIVLNQIIGLPNSHCEDLFAFSWKFDANNNKSSRICLYQACRIVFWAFLYRNDRFLFWFF